MRALRVVILLAFAAGPATAGRGWAAPYRPQGSVPPTGRSFPGAVAPLRDPGGASPTGAEGLPTVTLRAGTISGRVIKGNPELRVFLGIPYAAPPVGPLRFRAPVAPAPWTGIRACDEFGPACPQPSLQGPVRAPKRQDEDCLSINVWAPHGSPAELLPVMVWIHGGGMVVGASSQSFYDGTEFARDGVVLVSFNYRVGPLGFFAHPALRDARSPIGGANVGLEDQLAALRWVHEEIAKFGGDPGKVTIFGESAGAVSVCWLLACPAARGLFHRAIAQSGTAMAGFVRALADVEAEGIAAAEALGIDAASPPEATAAALRALDPKTLIDTLKPTIYANEGQRFGPVVDGTLVPESPESCFRKGTIAPVPIIVGTNNGDGSIFARAVPVRGELGVRATLRALVGAEARRAAELYDLGGEREVPEIVLDIATDLSFVAPARRMARAVSDRGGKIWLYHFTKGPGELGATFGKAPHGFEIPFVFGSSELGRRIAGAAVLGDRMREAWVRFAQQGDPNGEGLPEWPAYSRQDDVHLEFGDAIRVGSGLRARFCDLCDTAAEKRRPRSDDR